jgi:hypothetical protein
MLETAAREAHCSRLDLTPIRKPVNWEAIGGLNYFPVTGESTAIPVSGAVFCNLLCGKIVQKVHV